MSSPPSSQIAAEAPRRIRERHCIATGASLPETALVRFARAPDGTVTPDVAAKLPGRGVWVRAERAAIERAAKKGGFARGFKESAKVPEGLADAVERALARRCLDLLGLARRAGTIAVGHTQTEAALRAGPALLLIEASDGAEEAREKLMSLHIGLWSVPPRAVGCFESTELGVALGRERVIHACLLQERLATGWAAEIGRLAGFRPIVPSSWPDSWRFVSWAPSLEGPALEGAGADTART